jgi:hypothetical protein
MTVFALLVCVVFVGLTSFVVSSPARVGEAVLCGLGFFVLPCLLISPLAGALWATCLFGVWSISDSARLRRLRFESTQVPDRVPQEWRIR